MVEIKKNRSPKKQETKKPIFSHKIQITEHKSAQPIHL